MLFSLVPVGIVVSLAADPVMLVVTTNDPVISA
jgi:hypothetical protein